jgi:hypothetical protein
MQFSGINRLSVALGGYQQRPFVGKAQTIIGYRLRYGKAHEQQGQQQHNSLLIQIQIFDALHDVTSRMIFGRKPAVSRRLSFGWGRDRPRLC